MTAPCIPIASLRSLVGQVTPGLLHGIGMALPYDDELVKCLWSDGEIHRFDDIPHDRRYNLCMGPPRSEVYIQ